MITSIRTTVLASVLVFTLAATADADPVALGWPQPGGPETPIFITYSYSNLLDGTFLLLEPHLLRAATEEALQVWARYAPLHFIEVPDGGPRPGDAPYLATGFPQVRLGHHMTTDAAHAFFPNEYDGLGGDVHFDSGAPWALDGGPWNYLEVVAHELGHALGLVHNVEERAIMNPQYPQQRFSGLTTAFLFPADIAQIRALYGAGAGSVTPAPIPEPATLLLTGFGIGLLSSRRLLAAARRSD